MKVTRRDVLKLAAGSAMGLLFSPLPWKVLDDSAIWTQNWPWIPEPPSGEQQVASTTCTLCPAGCGIRARCINGNPVHLSGMPGHPYGLGSLCAAGLVAHHLSYHPLRVRQPLRRIHRANGIDSSPISLDDAARSVVEAIRMSAGKGSVAVLDRRPGRTVSYVYRQWLGGLPNGLIVSPDPAGCETAIMPGAEGEAQGTFGFDLERANAIVSFGAPLVDGWGAPGAMMRLLDRRRESGHPIIIQVESRASRTAMEADAWVAVAPGTEGVFALGLADVLVREGLVHPGAEDLQHLRRLIGPFTADRCAVMTGVPAEKMLEIARLIAAHSPAVTIAGGDPGAGPWNQADRTATASLNVLWTALNQPGGVTWRAALPSPGESKSPLAPRMYLRDVPDHSIAVLIIDAAEDGFALPYEALARTLVNDAPMVVSLSPFLAGISRHADLVIPAPAPLERWDDLPTPPGVAAASYAIAAPLQKPAEGSVDPIAFVNALSSAVGAPCDISSAEVGLKQRSALVYGLRRGDVCDETGRTPLAGIASADQFFEMLKKGSVWMDEPQQIPPGQQQVFPEQISVEKIHQSLLSVKPGHQGETLLLMPFGPRAMAGTGQVSPVLSKLYQESELLPGPSQGFIHPQTAASCGIGDSALVEVHTSRGKCAITVHRDRSAMPGVLFLAIGPEPEALRQHPLQGNPLALCLGDDGTWRLATGTVTKA